MAAPPNDPNATRQSQTDEYNGTTQQKAQATDQYPRCVQKCTKCLPNTAQPSGYAIQQGQIKFHGNANSDQAKFPDRGSTCVPCDTPDQPSQSCEQLAERTSSDEVPYMIFNTDVRIVCEPDTNKSSRPPLVAMSMQEKITEEVTIDETTEKTSAMPSQIGSTPIGDDASKMCQQEEIRDDAEEDDTIIESLTSREISETKMQASIKQDKTRVANSDKLGKSLQDVKSNESHGFENGCLSDERTPDQRVGDSSKSPREVSSFERDLCTCTRQCASQAAAASSSSKAAVVGELSRECSNPSQGSNGIREVTNPLKTASKLSCSASQSGSSTKKSLSLKEQTSAIVCFSKHVSGTIEEGSSVSRSESCAKKSLSSKDETSKQEHPLKEQAGVTDSAPQSEVRKETSYSPKEQTSKPESSSKQQQGSSTTRAEDCVTKPSNSKDQTSQTECLSPVVLQQSSNVLAHLPSDSTLVNSKLTQENLNLCKQLCDKLNKIPQLESALQKNQTIKAEQRTSTSKQILPTRRESSRFSESIKKPIRHESPFKKSFLQHEAALKKATSSRQESILRTILSRQEMSSRICPPVRKKTSPEAAKTAASAHPTDQKERSESRIKMAEKPSVLTAQSKGRSSQSPMQFTSSSSDKRKSKTATPKSNSEALHMQSPSGQKLRPESTQKLIKKSKSSISNVLADKTPTAKSSIRSTSKVLPQSDKITTPPQSLSKSDKTSPQSKNTPEKTPLQSRPGSDRTPSQSQSMSIKTPLEAQSKPDKTPRQSESKSDKNSRQSHSKSDKTPRQSESKSDKHSRQSQSKSDKTPRQSESKSDKHSRQSQSKSDTTPRQSESKSDKNSRQSQSKSDKTPPQSKSEHSVQSKSASQRIGSASNLSRHPDEEKENEERIDEADLQDGDTEPRWCIQAYYLPLYQCPNCQQITPYPFSCQFGCGSCPTPSDVHQCLPCSLNPGPYVSCFYPICYQACLPPSPPDKQSESAEPPPRDHTEENDLLRHEKEHDFQHSKEKQDPQSSNTKSDQSKESCPTCNVTCPTNTATCPCSVSCNPCNNPYGAPCQTCDCDTSEASVDESRKTDRRSIESDQSALHSQGFGTTKSESSADELTSTHKGRPSVVSGTPIERNKTDGTSKARRMGSQDSTKKTNKKPGQETSVKKSSENERQQSKRTKRVPVIRRGAKNEGSVGSASNKNRRCTRAQLHDETEEKCLHTSRIKNQRHSRRRSNSAHSAFRCCTIPLLPTSAERTINFDQGNRTERRNETKMAVISGEFSKTGKICTENTSFRPAESNGIARFAQYQVNTYAQGFIPRTTLHKAQTTTELNRVDKVSLLRPKDNSLVIRGEAPNRAFSIPEKENSRNSYPYSQEGTSRKNATGTKCGQIKTETTLQIVPSADTASFSHCRRRGHPHHKNMYSPHNLACTSRLNRIFRPTKHQAVKKCVNLSNHEKIISSPLSERKTYQLEVRNNLVSHPSSVPFYAQDFVTHHANRGSCIDLEYSRRECIKNTALPERRHICRKRVLANVLRRSRPLHSNLRCPQDIFRTPRAGRQLRVKPLLPRPRRTRKRRRIVIQERLQATQTTLT